jgi:hypothetical protein
MCSSMTLKVSFMTGLSWPCVLDLAAEVMLRLGGMLAAIFGGAIACSGSWEVAGVIRGWVVLEVSNGTNALTWWSDVRSVSVSGVGTEVRESSDIVGLGSMIAVVGTEIGSVLIPRATGGCGLGAVVVEVFVGG